METRTHSSINIDEPVAITVLAKAEGNCWGRFVSWSQDGINIKVDAALSAGSVVKLEMGDEVTIAEVCDCQSEGSEYSAGLSLVEWIGKSELERLRREIGSGAAAKLILAEAA